MAFPVGWPPRPASGVRSIRFYTRGIPTPDFADNAYLFVDGVGANPFLPVSSVRPGEDVSAPDYAGPHVVPSEPMGTSQRGDDPKPMIWSGTIWIMNTGTGILQFSFDGINVHGEVPPAPYHQRVFRNRYEAGIALRGGGAAAAGTITTVAKASLVDGETFTVDDGVNPPVTFEFDSNGVWNPLNIRINIVPLVTADDVKTAIIAAINGVGDTLLMSAIDGGAATVTLSQDIGGAQGNTAQSDTVVAPGFIITNMTGGITNGSFVVEAW
jgi:hypothetical protein